MPHPSYNHTAYYIFTLQLHAQLYYFIASG